MHEDTLDARWFLGLSLAIWVALMKRYKLFSTHCILRGRSVTLPKPRDRRSQYSELLQNVNRQM